MGDFSLDLRAVLTILSIITAITLALIFQWWRNRKFLSYDVIANTPLLTAKEEIREKLQILYEGKTVKNVRLLNLKIINDGKQPIDEKDFKKSIDFIFSSDAEILSAEPIKINPENLEVSLSFKENRLSINPLLMNSKDFIEIKVIISAYENLVKCDARIVGVKEIKKIKESNLAYFFISAVISLFSVLISIYLVANTKPVETTLGIPNGFIVIVLIVAGAFSIAMFTAQTIIKVRDLLK